jgi:hypothetical protein
MRKLKTTIIFFVFIFICPFFCEAQSHVISTIAGNGALGYSGDGGPAKLATLGEPTWIAVDTLGNVYIADGFRIRKIDAAGIIHTVAGNGIVGFAGDGGAATAAELNYTFGLGVDVYGNLYIADTRNYRIRKVNTTGIISTVAGNGIDSFSGDGGPATMASIKNVMGIVVDAVGNIYFSESGRIRKVNTSGIITTIAGTGIVGYSGDGGPATAAQLDSGYMAMDAANNIYIFDGQGTHLRKIDPSGMITTIASNVTGIDGGDGGPATAAGFLSPAGIAADRLGNVYIGGWESSRIRQVQTSGVIRTIAGTGVPGHNGDGGPANLAQIGSPNGLAIDKYGDMYISDEAGWIRKFNVVPAHSSASFTADITTDCDGIEYSILVKKYNPGMSVITYFGDGISATELISPAYTGTGGYATFKHNYSSTGTYTVKHVLVNNANALDSMSYSSLYKFCNTLSVNFYLDNNTDNIYEPGIDGNIMFPVTAEINLNGMPLDTIITLGGFYYKVFGNSGDTYTVKLLGLS